MAYEVVWSPRALDDVDSIARYISRDSPAYASAVVENIIGSTRILRGSPFMGRVVPELEDDAVRERFIYNYRIIDRVRLHTVTVATVIHGSRLLGNAFQQ